MRTTEGGGRKIVRFTLCKPEMFRVKGSKGRREDEDDSIYLEIVGPHSLECVHEMRSTKKPGKQR